MKRHLQIALAAASILAARSAIAERAEWSRYLDPPGNYGFTHSVVRGETFERPEYTIEYYRQANGPGTTQTVTMTIPRGSTGPFPAVVVPFYFPEAMLGYDPATGNPLPSFAEVSMMADLSRRGYVCISAAAYHLTYLKSQKPQRDFSRWQDAGAALVRDWPSWTGMGKLTFDTRLLVDILEADARVDKARIGIAGHSLGGKMALFAGATDPRIKAILASDPGVCWDRSNWNAVWYFGNRLAEMKASGLDIGGLLADFGCKPLCLLAGEYDGDWSETMLRKAYGHNATPGRLMVVNPRLGIHRPSKKSLESGYSFLDRHLKAPERPTPARHQEASGEGARTLRPAPPRRRQ